MQDTSAELNENQKTKQAKRGKKKEMWLWIRDFIIVLVVVLLLRTFVFQFIIVQGGSMLNTLHDGDTMYVSMLSARIQGYERGDVVICYYPGRTDRCVKRLIGLPGDTVQIVHGVVYINGEALKEDYLGTQAFYNYPEITLGEGEYFVLGDNRQISHDSHSQDVGAVTRLAGKARYILWPLHHAGKIE